MIPAAGYARRLPGLAESKEVTPLVGTGEPVIGPALTALAEAGVRDIVIVVRPEKRDIQATLGTGSDWNVSIEYVVTDPTGGPAETIDKAYERTRGTDVALAFPDILMEVADPYTPILEVLRSRTADVVLGLFPRSPLQAGDPVQLNEQGLVTAILPKAPAALNPGPEAPDRCWGIAVWSSPITEFFHQRVGRGAPPPKGTDWSVGQLFRDALAAGRPFVALPVASAPFLDIGTPTGLRWANEGRRSPPPPGNGGSKREEEDSH